MEPGVAPTPVISALLKVKQEDSESKANLFICQDPISKNQNKSKQSKPMELWER
jgi:hypothetical protein